jgi:hypothetical protein
MRFGIAYFPNLLTSLVGADDVSIAAFAAGDSADALRDALRESVDTLTAPPLREKLGGLVDMIGSSLPDDPAIRATPPAGRRPPGMLTHAELGQALRAEIPGAAELFRQAAESQNVLPPSGAMAGVITMTDATRGVWNAPANVGIAGLIAPTYQISDQEQQDLNTPVEGLAVNAIRTFVGRGVVVWGARTLDGNSNDWRYIQVRRTLIYVEQSVKTAPNSFVFAPNTATTWVTVTAMIESFLHGLWSSGGLMGPTPAQAFSVQCGLGSTMTADDVLNGVMIVQVRLQMVHPAEFIELVFKQQMLG